MALEEPPLEQYLDDIVTAVSISLEQDIPVNLEYIIDAVKFKIISEALFRNLYIKNRAARFLGMSRTNLLAIMNKPQFYYLKKTCVENAIHLRRRERGRYAKRPRRLVF